MKVTFPEKKTVFIRGDGSKREAQYASLAEIINFWGGNTETTL